MVAVNLFLKSMSQYDLAASDHTSALTYVSIIAFNPCLLNKQVRGASSSSSMASSTSSLSYRRHRDEIDSE